MLYSTHKYEADSSLNGMKCVGLSVSPTGGYRGI